MYNGNNVHISPFDITMQKYASLNMVQSNERTDGQTDFNQLYLSPTDRHRHF